MTRDRLLIVSGVFLVLAGLAVAVLTATSGVPAEPSPLAQAGVAILVLFGVVWVLLQVIRSAGDDVGGQPPLVGAEPLVDPAPERTRSDPVLSGRALADLLSRAGEVARDDGLDAGLATVRPTLRASLLSAMLQGGYDREAAEAAIADGEWTEDAEAAAVLSADLDPPSGTLRQRIRVWLYPEQAVREYTRAAVGEIDRVATDLLPTVAGQQAPRTVPIVQPRLETLQRDVDGSLQAAVEVPGDDGDDDDGDDGTTDGDGTVGDGVTESADTVAAALEGNETAPVESDEESAGGGDDAAADGGVPLDGSPPHQGPRMAAEPEDTDGQVPPTDATARQTTVRRTVRWSGALAAAAFLAVSGVAASNLVLLLSATVPLVYVAYGAVSTTPDASDLRVSREISASPVPPGQEVEVSVTVKNAGDGTLPDVRVVDAVPDSLAVVTGSPRGAAALGPDEELTIEYSLAAKRGDYTFERPRVRLRGFGAGGVTTTAVEPTGDDRLACRLDANAPPIEEQGDRYAGQLATDDPGEGIEFHSTREYRPGDTVQRIDWRHYAKRGDLATINYRERHAATVVLVVDARAISRVVAGPGRPTAVELDAYAATRALTDLLSTGHDVAVAVLGTDGDGPAGLRWLPPGGGRRQRALAMDAFAAAVESTAYLPEWVVRDQIRQIGVLAPPRSQILLFSPLLDDLPVEAIETWGTFDHARSVLAPDVLTHNTVTGQFEAVRRRTRLARSQASGARTVDWRRGTPLPIVLEYAFAAEARGAMTDGGGV